ncbi:hypothetical protein EVAR_78869_1 [Eumeta japonica]|uniref:Uncharacterized protein n=1 Tax=Eumeta variegata TaxID=151549 RepID=A0A4C1U2F7_EUMVA|nr:hypothetical protein EVAR_78869_1 [Eumeta japonica]
MTENSPGTPSRHETAPRNATDARLQSDTYPHRRGPGEVMGRARDPPPRDRRAARVRAAVGLRPHGRSGPRDDSFRRARCGRKIDASAPARPSCRCGGSTAHAPARPLREWRPPDAGGDCSETAEGRQPAVRKREPM